MIAGVYATPRDSLALARQLENHSLRLSPAPLLYGKRILIHVHSKAHMVKISRSKQAMQRPHILVSRHFLLHCHRPTARLSTEHTDDLHLSPLRFLKLSVSLKCLFSIHLCVVLLLICVFVLFWGFFLLLFLLLLYFNTGFLRVALAGLELTVDQTGLEITEICLSLPSAEIKGMCHHCLTMHVFFFLFFTD